ncbi:MAG TPA: carbohydrate kinase [Terriglobales bacterium]|nr:carbohydrate kinase [Terriglobales bacterium]
MARRFNVVGIGEVLWDLLASGPKMGGAPANFAYHARSLGANGRAITRVGDDDLGRGILECFAELDLPTDTVQAGDTAPTGTARATLSADGSAHFSIQENAAWDFLEVRPEAQEAARNADAVCFGSLAQRSAMSRATIQHLVAAVPAHALRVFDVNLRQQYYSRPVIEQSLRLANVLKLNDEELRVLGEILGIAGSVENQILDLARRLGAGGRRGSRIPAVVALTRGANGSLLYREGVWSDCGSRAVEVVDTVGAGDSFTGALVLGLLNNMGLDAINSIANDVACYVCSQAGATPAMPTALAKRFQTKA